MHLHCGSKVVDLSRPQVMGVLNVTPDSFFDGGKHYSGEKLVLERALLAAELMVEAGAAFIDIGGESTRPGAAPVSEQQECDRVIPVVEALAGVEAVISVDTSTPLVMQEAAKKGAGMINDVRALRQPGAVGALLATGLPVCLMHMLGNPGTMQQNPVYDNVVNDVCDFLLGRIAVVTQEAQRQSLTPPQMILDPGFGFGKTDEHNIALLRHLSALSATGYPVLAGLSRKSMLGRLLGREPQERLAGSLALALIAVQNGAAIIRVHDVPETIDVIRVLQHVNLMGTD